jgi:hypothetical protein
MKAFWDKYHTELSDKMPITMALKELKKACKDYKKGEPYLNHLAKAKEIICDYASVKGIRLEDYLEK